MQILPLEFSSIIPPVIVVGWIGTVIAAVTKPVIGLGRTVAKRLRDPTRDIFGNRKGAGDPDPVAEGLRAATTTATRNIQGRTDTALADLGLGPKPLPKSNIALIIAIGIGFFVLSKR